MVRRGPFDVDVCALVSERVGGLILRGDCREQMAAMDAESIDAVVCDPPYGLEFMGKEWDRLGAVNESAEDSPGWRAGTGGTGKPDANNGIPFGGAGQRIRYGKSAASMQSWHQSWAEEAYRVLKPGGYLLAFGGTRTFHRLAVAIEDAGFEIRDCLSWMYGSGFPKSLDVSKAMDKATGAVKTTEDLFGEPITDLAKQWQGWGTALKPSWEPVVMARKPLAEKTVAANVERYGTGAINVDGCRISHTPGHEGTWGAKSKNPGTSKYGGNSYHSSITETSTERHSQGRWPANTVMDREAAKMLDEQSGVRKSASNRTATTGSHFSSGNELAASRTVYAGGAPYAGDTGGASRFFYTAKASRSERNAGLEGMVERRKKIAVIQTPGVANDGDWEDGKQLSSSMANHHPTVKPISLMRWLVRMVTPPGGVVLDPFLGSGTTGCAAAIEGFDFIGIEQDAEYVEISERRIAHWAQFEPCFGGCGELGIPRPGHPALMGYLCKKCAKPSQLEMAVAD